MKFIAYGCSYTRGDELADDWLTGESFAKVNKSKRKSKGTYEWFQKATAAKNESFGYGNWHIEYEKLMKDRSYANSIAKELKAAAILSSKSDNYVNRGISGNSNKAIFLDILKDIQSGFITRKDIIFVGLTSTDRYSWFRHGHLANGMATGGEWPNTKVRDAILSSWSDDDFCYDTVVAFRAMQGLLRKHKFFYQTLHYPFTEMFEKPKIAQPVWQELEKIDAGAAAPHYSFHNEISKGIWEDPQHGFYHPRQEIADVVGRAIGKGIVAQLGGTNG
jgi:hypothetical protein